MSGRFPALLAAAILSLSHPAGSVAAQEEPKPGAQSPPRFIRVVSDQDYPPYIFRAADGSLQGIVPDQWKAWSEATGIEARLEGLPWSEALRKARSGEADVIDTIFKNTERMSVFLFTRPYAKIDVPVFFHKTISGIASLDDLKGFRVGVKAGDASIATLRNHGINDLIEFEGYKEIAEAASRLEIRVFSIDKPPALYWLYKLNIDKDFRSALSLGNGELHRAVRRSRPDLLDLVQWGFDAIPESRYAAIDRRWFGQGIGGSGPDLRIVLALFGGFAFLIVGLIALAAVLRSRVARATAELSEKLDLLEESQRRNRAFIAALPDIFFTMDSEGRYREGSTASPELLVADMSSLIGKSVDEVGIDPGLAEKKKAAIKTALKEHRMVVFEYELAVMAGHRFFEGRVVPLDEEKVIFIARDMTERKESERRLLASLQEKEILLREVHHRVKNNMQVISSLVSLQSESFRDDRDRELFTETQQRIRAMAQLHELLYSSQTMSSIEASEYIDRVVGELRSAYARDPQKVGIHLSLAPLVLSLDEAMPLGLIVNELVSNAFKHAFPAERRGSIRVELRAGKDRSLLVSDDGVGFPAGVDPLASRGMGITLLKSLTAQLGGKVLVERRREGTSFRVIF